LLAFAFLQHAKSVVDGITTVKILLNRIIEQSPDYPGHDHPWRPPESWRRQDRDIVENAKSILTDATSITGQGKHLQLIESAMATS